MQKGGCCFSVNGVWKDLLRGMNHFCLTPYPFTCTSPMSFREKKGPPSEDLGFPAMPAFTSPSSPSPHFLLHPLLKGPTESQDVGTFQALGPVPLHGQVTVLDELSPVVWLEGMKFQSLCSSGVHLHRLALSRLLRPSNRKEAGKGIVMVFYFQAVASTETKPGCPWLCQDALPHRTDSPWEAWRS